MVFSTSNARSGVRASRSSLGGWDRTPRSLACSRSCHANATSMGDGRRAGTPPTRRPRGPPRRPPPAASRLSSAPRAAAAGGAVGSRSVGARVVVVVDDPSPSLPRSEARLKVNASSPTPISASVAAAARAASRAAAAVSSSTSPSAVRLSSRAPGPAPGPDRAGAGRKPDGSGWSDRRSAIRSPVSGSTPLAARSSRRSFTSCISDRIFASYAPIIWWCSSWLTNGDAQPAATRAAASSAAALDVAFAAPTCLCRPVACTFGRLAVAFAALKPPNETFSSTGGPTSLFSGPPFVTRMTPTGAALATSLRRSLTNFSSLDAELLALLLPPPRLVLQRGAPLLGFEQPLLQAGALRGRLVEPPPFLVHSPVGLGQGIRQLLILRGELRARALVEGLRAGLVRREPPPLPAPLLAAGRVLLPVAEDEEEDVGDARQIPRAGRLQLQRAGVPEVV